MTAIQKLFRPLMVMLFMTLLTACAATGGAPKTASPQVSLQTIQQELPEDQLLDVWIEVFSPGVLPKREKDALGLSPEIRAAEARYIPIHLRSVMEKTGYWGAVRVVPSGSSGAELLVRGEILESNGQQLALRITAEDASGRVWFKRQYQGEAESSMYDNLPQNFDSFEAVYRLIANDLAQFRNKLSAQERVTIRRLADLRFAVDMSPDAFGAHLQRNEKGRYSINQLPAENDPAYQRVEALRERDFLLLDTLNGHYDNYYLQMSSPYLEWRKARSYEAEALAEVKKKANTRKALGAAAIIGAIALEVFGSRNTRASTGTLRDVMVIGGAVAIKQGMDINAQSPIHQAAIEELGDSFSNEAQPMVVQVDGEVYKLTGSAEDQYQQWRQLLHEIYASETGLLEPVPGG